ncbi:TPA: hypothetical protein DD449_02510 [Candidatus Berkelbacteria bacterium]|nr:hypothetical protein [Candidatus Berkelbacteria bacterium]
MSNLKIVNKNEINPVGNLSPKELLRTVKRMYNAGLLMQAFAVKTAIDNELYLTAEYINEADFFKKELDLDHQRYSELKRIGEAFEDVYSGNNSLTGDFAARAAKSETEEATYQEIENLGRNRIIALSSLGKDNVNKIFSSGETNINGKKLSLEYVRTIPAHDLRKYISSLLEEPANSKPPRNNHVKVLTERKAEMLKTLLKFKKQLEKSELSKEAFDFFINKVVPVLDPWTEQFLER